MSMRVLIELIDDLDIFLIHSEKIIFIVLKLFDLLGHSINSLDEMNVFDFEKISLLTVFLLKAVEDLLLFLGGCGYICLV